MSRTLQQTLLWGWEFLPPPQPPQVFLVRGFEVLVPHSGTLGCLVCLAPKLFLLVYLHRNVGQPTPPASHSLICPVLQTLPCHGSSPPSLLVSASPTGLDECFFINYLVVGLPYSSIFWQFWLFFLFKLVVPLSVMWGSKVCLPMPPSWPEVRLLPYFAMYNALLCIICVHIFGSNFQK